MFSRFTKTGTSYIFKQFGRNCAERERERERAREAVQSAGTGVSVSKRAQSDQYVRYVNSAKPRPGLDVY